MIPYNAHLELVDEYEKRGLIQTIRPRKPIEVNRLEKNVKKIESLYEEGYNCAVQVLGKILK